MNFAEKLREEAQDTNGKKITVEEFKEAVIAEASATMDEYHDKPRLGITIVMTGMRFAHIREGILFETKNDCTEEEFDTAVTEATHKMADDFMDADVTAAFLAPMTGMSFAISVERRLLKNESEETA